MKANELGNLYNQAISYSKLCCVITCEENIPGIYGGVCMSKTGCVRYKKNKM